MSQQAHLWSRYHAAALQTQTPSEAAKTADFALAEYNRRFEVLAKFEHELAEAHELLRISDQQIYIGLQALMTGSDMGEAFRRDGAATQAQAHWFEQMATLVKNHLRLVGNRYTIVPHGMDENHPHLKGRR